MLGMFPYIPYTTGIEYLLQRLKSKVVCLKLGVVRQTSCKLIDI